MNLVSGAIVYDKAGYWDDKLVFPVGYECVTRSCFVANEFKEPLILHASALSTPWTGRSKVNTSVR